MDTSQLNKKDPINFIFYRVGSAWDVNYDLKNWTSARWQDTGCNGNQRVYIWDAMHTGGQDAWRTNQYPMEPAGTSPCWPTARDHIRLFEGFVRDSHDPSWGVWSITSAHHDNYGHSQTDDWEGPEGRLRGAFYDGSGNKLWFVGAVWDVDLGNAGQWQGAYNNGLASVVELLY